jgi:hypothetical protein
VVLIFERGLPDQPAFRSLQLEWTGAWTSQQRDVNRAQLVLSVKAPERPITDDLKIRRAHRRSV